MTYYQGFLGQVDKKLSNEKFVNGAPPAVLENERKKKADAEAKIKTLEERLDLCDQLSFATKRKSPVGSSRSENFPKRGTDASLSK
ncbi:MAG: hypothetical protein WDO15_18140 [Bacteroidota bacterium]